MTVRGIISSRVFVIMQADVASSQGTDFKVDGGLTSCYVTPLGEQILPPPSGLALQ